MEIAFYYFYVGKYHFRFYQNKFKTLSKWSKIGWKKKGNVQILQFDFLIKTTENNIIVLKLSKKLP